MSEHTYHSGQAVPPLSERLCIAISSQKGGVAKTTTCLSLGACLAEINAAELGAADPGKGAATLRPSSAAPNSAADFGAADSGAGQARSSETAATLLIDLDPQAHLTHSFGIEPEKLRRTIADVLLHQSTLLAASRQTVLSNLDLVPANRGLLLMDKLLYKAESSASAGAANAELGYEYRLKNALQALPGRFYDYVLSDCPPTFGPLTINALSAAQLVIIPVTCDYFSAESLQHYLGLLDLLKRKSNPTLQYRILVTMLDHRTRISRLILEQYRRKYGDLMLNTTISLDVRLRESPLFNRPITTYAKDSRGAEEYRALTRELLTWMDKTPIRKTTT